MADVASSREATDDEDLMLAASAIDEVLKFIPDGAEEVPPETLHTEDGREVYDREPGRFRKARLEAVAATYRKLAGELRDQQP